MMWSGQDLAVGAVAVVGLLVLARRMTGAMRASARDAAAPCPNCGGDEHCAPTPPQRPAR